MSFVQAYKGKWMWVLTGIIVGAGLGGAFTYRQRHAPLPQSPAPDGAYCENGIAAARGHTPVVPGGTVPSIQPADQAAWTPKINDPKPAEPAPTGMAWIP